MKIYMVIDNSLVIKNADGVDVWRGQPEGQEVAWATSIPNSDDGLVLYEPYPAGWQQVHGFQNLVRVSPNGTIVWRAELPEKATKYVSAKLLTDRLKAFAPSYDVDLNVDTGKILNQVWTK